MYQKKKFFDKIAEETIFYITQTYMTDMAIEVFTNKLTFTFEC